MNVGLSHTYQAEHSISLCVSGIWVHTQMASHTLAGREQQPRASSFDIKRVRILFLFKKRHGYIMK